MSLLLTAGPAVEPVTLAEAKVHLRVDTDVEDTLIASLIVTSRLHVEASLGLALITQSWTWFRDAWPPGPAVDLPLRPIQSIAAVRTYDAGDIPTTLDPAAYFLDSTGTPPRLVRHGALPWPRIWPEPGRIANGIEITFTAGYGPIAEAVPSPIRQAILILIAHWHEHRTPIEDGPHAAPVPTMVVDLLAPYRSVRL
ncbi:MAG TPA: head-tail connector protein [Hyphomicrobiaceae bacterium]|nr:head-tail connector protein [Hyphomicrobiaceae bacterium]